ncbi:hypothetical protein PC129_g763 [Phytophthora cactorum]|uniref:Uncharacterized protein n=1 Tax=Phytophthora cactorum TaxID=29920 RepID=A0A329SYA0_9STRA|nr:hypothetical protein Pcac1_g264 [Phytophthora cactorum]KAG2848837.1 hypothetical protein PC111_g301 [Phytophthora cactorum]KAG2849140.1 hypothetical protein PC112_g450 [Phytophthora cactorum]KAG2869019.1 hypothetical protein PC113_g535 [Phytophthora cactorum]KAG2934955.1 hypothetical protein PC114_g814 [Phytophthora cactorum]
MNVWAIDDEPVASRHQVKKTSFADEVEVASTSGWGDDTKSQRRKQRGKVEFLVEDQQDSDDDANDAASGKAANASMANMTSVKANQISSADVVVAVDNGVEPAQTSGSKQERQIRKEQKRESPAKSNQEITVHHLVRDFLLMHCHEDVVRILDQERSMPLLGATEVKQLSRRLTSTDKTSESPSVPSSLLERFLVCSNEAKVKARAKRNAKERSVAAEKTPIRTSSTGRQKPELNVITSNLDQTASRNAIIAPVTDQGYNRLNHPGSTPHHPGPVIGEPGSTPMARAKDLQLYGFEDVDDDVEKTLSSSIAEGDDTTDENANQLSHYALEKRSSKTGLKRVQLGNPGSTPTKEYIFFRETPPSFVTETIEDAVEVFEKLGNNPEFVKQAVLVERFIEMQSSEVSKYTIGQVVEGLGAQSNINGVVSKIYGSRLCGTAGSGTIVIDTCPEQANE